MRGVLVGPRNKVEQRKKTSFAQGVKNLAHVGDGWMAGAADLVESLKIDDDPITIPDCFGMLARELEYGEVECWTRPIAKYCFRVASTSLAKIRLMRWVREGTGGLSFGIEISMSIEEQEPKSVLDLDKTPGNFVENIAQLFDSQGGPIRAM